MDGLWTADEIKKAESDPKMTTEEGHLLSIMSLLEEHEEGLSNAEIDALLNNNSQWVASWHLRELLAAGFIEYTSQFFGEPGKYSITESGRDFLQKLRGRSPGAPEKSQ